MLIHSTVTEGSNDIKQKTSFATFAVHNQCVYWSCAEMCQIQPKIMPETQMARCQICRSQRRIQYNPTGTFQYQHVFPFYQLQSVSCISHIKTSTNTSSGNVCNWSLEKIYCQMRSISFQSRTMPCSIGYRMDSRPRCSLHATAGLEKSRFKQIKK